MNLNGKSVSRETQARLDHFVSLFQKWSKSINLVAPSTIEDSWNRHVADSAQIYQLFPGPKTWVDLGSGGGFPGIITAIMMAELNDGWVHLVESNNKKASFLRLALRETGARGSIHPVRIEDSGKEIPHCDVISGRALADLDKLLEFSYPWSEKNTAIRMFFHKGRDYRAEIVKAHGRWRFDLLEHVSVVERDSVVLEISNLRHLT
jgi:16S rRNA (guanine527-N7)-methyltransferase